MQIDQCLSCSRYEPIIGQTYDILNGVGANLANIEDDAQMGYMNLEQDMIEFMRIEKMHEMKKEGELQYATAKKRDENEQDFKNQWDDGVKMVWKLTPVETQKPQINWRKDINSEDKSPAKLDSYQAGASQANDQQGSTIQAGSAGEWMQKHYDSMKEILSRKTDEQKNPEGGKKSENEKDSRLKELQQIINEGFARGKSGASDALNQLKNNGYEQALQNACSKENIDTMLAFSLAAVETGGDPGRGVFGKGGDNVKEGIEAGVKAVKEAAAHQKGTNPIGLAQAFNGWNDGLDKINKDDTQFTIEWTDACGDGNAKAYFPAVAQAYMDIKAANVGFSQASTDINGGSKGACFPIATADLAKAYLVQDYGASEQDGGVVAVSNCIVIKLPEKTPLHLPCDGTPSEMSYDETIGNYVSVNDSSVGTEYILGGLSYASGGSKLGDTFGYSSDKLIIQVKTKSGFIDPKSVWQKLCGKKSDKESIGDLIEQENEKVSNTD